MNQRILLRVKLSLATGERIRLDLSVTPLPHEVAVPLSLWSWRG
jgi:hypothetical protein